MLCYKYIYPGISTFVVTQPLYVLYVERLSRCEGLSGAQVHDLQLVLVVHQHVVGLEVQVDDPAAVQVVHGTQDLNQQLGHMHLRIQIPVREVPSFI